MPPARPRAPGLAALLGAVAGILVLAGAYLWVLGGSNPAAREAVGGGFELTTASGRSVTDRDFRGRYMLIYFGYTQCRDVCPATLTTLGPALAALGPRGDAIQPVFITVDPVHDTPAVLRGYVAGFTPRLIGLTGTERSLRRVRRAYRVQTVAHPGGGAGGGIEHSSVLLLVGPDGNYIAPIRADQPSAAMALDIAAHLS